MDPTNDIMPKPSAVSSGTANKTMQTPLAGNAPAVGGTIGQQPGTVADRPVQGGAPVPPVPPAVPTPPPISNPPVGPTPHIPSVPPVPTPPPAGVSASPVDSPKVRPVMAAPGPRPVNIDGVNGAAMPKSMADPVVSPTRPSGAIVGERPSEASVPVNDGMAVSVDSFSASDVAQTPSVSFADPAEQPIASANQQISAPKKKSNKLLITLSIIAFVVAAALVAVLVMEIMGVGLFSSK